MTDTDAVRELHDLIEERVAAIAARDGAPLRSREHADVVTFNVVPPLTLTGNQAVIEQMQAWFDGYRRGPHYEVHDLRIDAETELGYCSFLYHVSGQLVDGNDVDMWVRATLVCKKIGGRWLIVHDHESVPFDPATGRAVTNPQSQ